MLTDAQRKAERAQQLLNEPLIKEALYAIRKSCYDGMESTGLDAKEMREDLYMLLKACMMFESEFQSFINRGKLDALNQTNEINRLIR